LKKSEKKTNKLAAYLLGLLFCIVFAQLAFASQEDLISMDGCVAQGVFVGGGHCHYNADYLDLRNNVSSFSFSVDFDKPFSNMDNQTYIVPMLTTMSLTNFASYINVCIDGARGSKIHAIDVYIDEEKNVDNYGVKSMDNCFGGGVIFEGNQGPVNYLFAEPGLHKVKVVLATQNNGTCGKIVKEFDVIVLHPVLSIDGSSSQIVSFREGETDQTIYLTWSITNLGTSTAVLKEIQATGCGAGLECSFPGFGSLSVDPDHTIILIEEVKLTNPATASFANEIGIKLNYTDLFEANDLWKEPNKPIFVPVLFSEKQGFHVELVGGEQNFCIGKDGRLGGTGPGDVPHILFKWSWSDISTNTCDREEVTDLDFVYCDPAQFSIELLKRLNRINRLAKQEDIAGAQALQNFQAYLIGDAFNEDFRKDFDYYYTQTAFLEASWYNSSETPWDLYFVDEQALQFAPEAISSGLYNVQIEFEFEDEDFDFFYIQDQTTLTAKIKVRLTKLRDPLIANSLYNLPFNGEVGLQARPGEASPERTGYGLGFNGAELKVNEFNPGFFITTKGNGEKTVSTSFEQDFGNLNVLDRGIILSIANDASSIKFSPSTATPVIMKINSSGERTDGYYFVRSQNQLLSSPASYMALWTGFASTPMSCANFDNSALYYRWHDSQSFNVPNIVDEPSYGFSWEEIPQENRQAQLYLQSVFYTPLDSGMSLEGSTSDTELISPSAVNTIPLNYKTMQSTLEGVFGLIEENYVCVSFEEDAVEFWWNPQKIVSELEDVKANTILEESICAVEGQVR